MAIWERGIQRMLKLFGLRCRATVNSQTLDFYGIFDEENRLETSDGISVIIKGSVLTVDRATAKHMTRGIAITIDDAPWFVREVLQTGDGELARLSIVGEANECY